MCCYEGEAYTPNTSIMATTSQDGCITSSIECGIDGNTAKLVFQVEKNCPKSLEANQMDKLEWKMNTVARNVADLEYTVNGKLDALEGKMDMVVRKVDDLAQMLEQHIAKSGNLIVTKFRDTL